VKTDVAVKSLDEWCVAYDFLQIKKVNISPTVNISVVAPMNQAVVNVVGSSSLLLPVVGIGQVVMDPDLVEMSICDLDTMCYFFFFIQILVTGPIFFLLCNYFF